MPNTQPSYYDVLQLRRTASAAEVKRSYYKLAKQYHPDRVSSERRAQALKTMHLLNQAYRVLGSERNRKAYNKVLTKQSKPARKGKIMSYMETLKFLFWPITETSEG